jgi:hypothetical protein
MRIAQINGAGEFVRLLHEAVDTIQQITNVAKRAGLVAFSEERYLI